MYGDLEENMDLVLEKMNEWHLIGEDRELTSNERDKRKMLKHVLCNSIRRERDWIGTKIQCTMVERSSRFFNVNIQC